MEGHDEELFFRNLFLWPPAEQTGKDLRYFPPERTSDEDKQVCKGLERITKIVEKKHGTLVLVDRKIVFLEYMLRDSKIVLGPIRQELHEQEFGISKGYVRPVHRGSVAYENHDSRWVMPVRFRIAYDAQRGTLDFVDSHSYIMLFEEDFTRKGKRVSQADFSGIRQVEDFRIVAGDKAVWKYMERTLARKNSEGKTMLQQAKEYVAQQNHAE